MEYCHKKQERQKDEGQKNHMRAEPLNNLFAHHFLPIDLVAATLHWAADEEHTRRGSVITSP